MKTLMERRNFLKLLPLLSLLPLLDAAPRSAEGASGSYLSQGKPNLIIFLFDTLSARHMSLYGYQRETTPNLARFAERATVYHAHRAAGNYTPPGTASLLTGTYPWAHRAFHPGGTVAQNYAPRNLFRLLGESYQRIAFPHNMYAHLLVHHFRQDVDLYVAPEEFSLVDGTYHDQAFSNDVDVAFRSFQDLLFKHGDYPASLYLSLADKLNLLAQERIGFRRYEELYPRGVANMVLYKVYFLLEDIIDGVVDLLGKAHKPFLAYFHLFPPHEPYAPRREFVGMFDDGWAPATKELHPLSLGEPQEMLNKWRTVYDEYVANVDAEFARLSDFLDRTGLADNSYIVVTSDHGQLFERGYHGHITPMLYEPLIHIPLLISSPGQRQRRDVFGPTSCVDLLPTLLDAIGQGVPDWCEGTVLPASGGAEEPSERSVYALEAKSNPQHAPLTEGTITLIKGRHKLIHYFGYAGYERRYELYDLENDPEEMEDLCLSRRSVAADLQNELEAKLEEVNRPYRSG
jgi:arylsulfatase A-like enzyme